MLTLAETDAPPPILRAATWSAAALAACASLLHWIATDGATHTWSADAAVSLVAGAGLMGLGILLVAAPWSARSARAAYLISATWAVVVVLAVVLPLLSGWTSGHAGDAGHAGHDVGGGEPLAIAGAIRTALEVALIGVLLWMYRMTGPAEAEGH